MQIRTSEVAALVIVLVSYAIGGYIFPRLPAQVASHWNAQGAVDGYTSSFWGAFLLPVVLTVLWVLLLVIPRIDPKAHNIALFRSHFDRFIILLFLFFLYVYLLTVWWNLGFEFRFTRLLIPALALLLYEMGVLIQHAKPNWSIGIRTPWTLSNDQVWQQTHRLGGRLFKYVAVVSLAGFVFPGFAIWLLMIPLVGVTVFIIGYSYVKFRKQSEDHPHRERNG